VDVGSQVKQGQLLATMEAPEIGSQLAGSQSKLESFNALYQASKATYNRLLETSKTPGTISPNELELALAKQNSDLAQLNAAKASAREITDTRNYLEIRAPFSGVISARNVSTGAYVGPAGKGSDMPIFSLQQQNKLRLVASIPAMYTSFLNNKSKVNFTVNSLAGEKFTATIARLSGALDNRLRSESIEMDVDNSSKKLLPGMIAEISIPLPAQDSSFVVPKSAVVNSTQKIFVIRKLNGKADWVEIKKGRDADGKTEVYGGGLKTGDTLVTSGSEEIRDGNVIH
jgi:RND family efflux transporter MFP subunit